MRKYISFFMVASVMFLLGCMSAANSATQVVISPATNTPVPSPSAISVTATSFFIPYVDVNEFLEKADDRLRFKDWPFSLVLPADWPTDRFTGRNFSSDMTAATFVRNPLPNREIFPAVTIIFNRIPNGLDVEQYSEVLMKESEAYFTNILDTFTSSDGTMNLENAVGYVTRYKENDNETLTYFIYATSGDVGVQVIMAGDPDSMEEIKEELESIIRSFQFER